MKAIWYLFVLIMGVGILVRFILENNHSKLKKDMFSGGEAGDVIIERSNGMKEKITKVHMKVQGEWVEMPNVEGVLQTDENGCIIGSYIRKKKNKEEKDMREIKKGDKVKIISDIDENFDNDRIVGNIYTVDCIKIERETGKSYAILKETTERPYIYNCKLVDEKEKQFTKSDLKYGDIVELRNGNRYVYVKNYFDLIGYDPKTYDAIVSLKNGHDIPISDYNNKLLYKKRGECKYDIMKILDKNEICKNLKWTLERSKTEMTLEEVCQELGRDIKIVKEH